MSRSKHISNVDRREIRRLIREEVKKRQLIQEEIQNFKNKVIIYERNARRKGLSQRDINKGTLKLINEGWGDVAADMIKRWLASKVLGMFGIEKSTDPTLYTFLENIFEAIEYTRLAEYFGTNQCEEVMGVVTEAITETVTELGGEIIISYLASKFLSQGMSSSIDAALDSSLANVSQEAINEVVVGIVKGYLQEPMRTYICDGQLMDTMSGLFGDATGGILGGGDSESESNWIGTLMGLLGGHFGSKILGQMT